MSVYDYDMAELQKNLNQVLSGLVIMSVMHFWLKFTQPLIFQSLLPWKNFFTMPLIQIRLFGFKAEGSLERPWKAPNPFADFMGQADAPATPVEAIEEDSQDKKSSASVSSESVSFVEEVKEEDEVASSSSEKRQSTSVKSRKPRKEE
jgi:hypothetical protein